jgi:hypothetical protein
MRLETRRAARRSLRSRLRHRHHRNVPDNTLDSTSPSRYVHHLQPETSCIRLEAARGIRLIQARPILFSTAEYTLPGCSVPVRMRFVNTGYQ